MILSKAIPVSHIISKAFILFILIVKNMGDMSSNSGFNKVILAPLSTRYLTQSNLFYLIARYNAVIPYLDIKFISAPALYKTSMMVKLPEYAAIPTAVTPLFLVKSRG